MKSLYLIIFSLGVLVSCNTDQVEVVSKGTDSTLTTEAVSLDSAIIRTQVKTRLFSDPEREDTFKLIVRGKDLVNAIIDFQIVTAQGQVIYSERFESTYLIGPITADMTDSLAQEAQIRTRISEFFAESNFMQPAIKPGTAFDKNYSDKAIWDELKSDSFAIGFKYLLGKEDGRRIAYSKKLGKAVMYFNCC